MRRHAYALCLALALGCGNDKPANPDGGPKPGEDPNAGSPFVRLTVDSDPSELHRISSIALAVGPENRIGVAYFAKLNDKDFQLRYREVRDGQVQSTFEPIATVQRVFGVSLSFGPDGQPVVAYLGGGSDGSVLWLQSDMALSYRGAQGTWTERIAVRRGDEAKVNSPVSDTGLLVGLNPALVFSGSEAIVVYRDGHDGQFPQQDWAGSDLEVATGGPTTWQHRVVAAGGDTKKAYGGHINMVMAGGQPALVSDQAYGGPDATGQNVLFQRRNADGATWSAPLQVQTVGNTQLGASLAYDAQEGFGIAVVDRNSDRLTYTECAGTTATKCTVPGDWSLPFPVYQAGSGGWYPSLAFDPTTHEPAIAFHVCSQEAGRNETSCTPADDQLLISTRISGTWREVLVDSAGGWSPKLAFLSSGKRVVLYRVPSSGTLTLAVER
ncbi:hypothetical protein DRW03_30490 [Corallococcus sp. H22C18031201]|nr:hypothetical protein DRW03_30490 [Corallococcus sp. H22C18031201]